ncbi:uncharacterized protein N7515_008828 [Penicillium bovifimosum]|uniref:Uncharacterized protein n=1 Tax=Penicillium bovifimosum TaxID=126998 RepID=A0A9W9KY73_9EURO|nr:uncharacterized protein N7515_008828 [Penicillium bovifimosum]KAJ5125003.1 hypothetical protein N7515_008828 [Penicillium bovifimosum]
MSLLMPPYALPMMDWRTGDLDHTTEILLFPLYLLHLLRLLDMNGMARGDDQKTGIISSAIRKSDNLDEIDWERVGHNTSSVGSDFFG